MIEYQKLKDWKYRVLKTFSIQTDIIPNHPIQSHFSTLTKSGRLYIKKGFCWDGASGAIDSENIMRGSCVHDAFCNWHQQGYLTKSHRKQADKLLYHIIKQDGMSDFRANYVYKAVQTYVAIRYK